MRKKSLYPKVAICVRLNPLLLKKVDKIAENQEIERSEVIRKLLENAIHSYEIIAK